MDLTNTNSQTQPTITNGSLKQQHPTTATVSPPPSAAVSYKECLKNHAASIGGHALDGCGEFMPSSSSNPTEPRSLTCAACGCHRNFHRRDTHELNPKPSFISFYHSPLPPPHSGPGPSTSPSPMSSPSPPPISHHFPGDFRGLNFNCSKPSGKKRYRTRFSQEQKQKMQSFSEKLGWRMQKGDEGMVQDFCNQIGVSRGVFKVWMHNNKNTSRNRSFHLDPHHPSANHHNPYNTNHIHSN
ncbi:hypothetical protein Fmac_003246 [Flemingia macrophylla]|uniref:ZF-HD dimerization-type domain-containing protein n=1 Tax=Flemingia macrophylla TaxID=520843 RepID=A0ABD1NMW6_9FABA